jgi:hypothetical protein
VFDFYLNFETIIVMSISYPSSIPTTLSTSSHSFDNNISRESSSSLLSPCAALGLAVPTLTRPSALATCDCGGTCDCCKSKFESANLADSTNRIQSPHPISTSPQHVVLPTGMPIPPPGGYLEPNSHFFVNGQPEDVLQFLLRVLNEKSVDWTICPNAYKLKCEAYRHSVRIEFIARIFHMQCPEAKPSDPPRFAVEFQRRFGDGMFFFQLYQEIHDSFAPIEANACLKRRALRLQNPGMLECPELNIPELKCSRQTTCDDLQALLEMSSSDCVDVKAMAIAALADMSANPEFKYIMLEKGCAELFIKCLNCTYGDVHRCAITGLSNLISCGKNKSVCNKILDEQPTIAAIEKHATSKCPKTVREAARAMSYLCNTLKLQVKDDDCVKRCIRSLVRSCDTQAREVAKHTLDTMDSATD